MGEIDGCTVQLCHGQRIEDCGVYFKESGWIMVHTDSNRFWYPPHRVESVRAGAIGGDF